MEGHVQVEATGFGLCRRTRLYPGESPQAAADRLVLAEDRRRRALHQAWLRKNQSMPSHSTPPSVVVVQPQRVAA
ncbi:MAG: copper-binding protein [Synechococcus sp.]